MEVVTVNASTVRVGDLASLEGEEFRVADMFALRGGGKKVLFESSEFITLDLTTPLVVRRFRSIEIAR
ncbi:hypothetical protein AB0D49_14845 [Streptomyces sp. NPDC048290]|uniref:hypothetical protein n=1 Tax=Streptomyces sp. NPDC048290 TaxID=3155811 RepID=UPI00344739F8